jgi:multidrug resistance efflux pump
MAAKHSAYDQLQGELAGTDALLERERATIDVNNPDAVARFRQQLEQRDALFRRSTGPAAAELTGATTRYNASVGQYNTQCANHSWDPVLLSQVQAALSCPAP